MSEETPTHDGRFSFFKQLDWNYAAIVAAIGLVEFGAAGWLSSMERSDKTLGAASPAVAEYTVLIQDLLRPPDPPAKNAADATTPDASASAAKKKTKPREAAPATRAKGAGAAPSASRDLRAARDDARGKGPVGIVGALGGVDAQVRAVFDPTTASAEVDPAFRRAGDVLARNEAARPGVHKRAHGERGDLRETIGDDALGGGIGKKRREIAVKTRPKRETIAPPKVVGGKPEVTGGTLPDPSIIGDSIRRRLAAIRACYEAALRLDDRVAGKIVVLFTITKTGAVVAGEIESNTTHDAALGACVLRRLRGFRFPALKDGPLTVGYPFIFAPAKK